MAYSGGGRRLSGGDGLRRDGAGREVGRQGRREVPSVECRFEPQLHHSLAGESLMHFLVRVHDRRYRNERKTLAQGLASGNRWITRAPAMALVLETRPAVGAFIVCGARSLHSVP